MAAPSLQAKAELTSVLVCVCMFSIEIYMHAPIATKLGIGVDRVQEQVFNALGVPQVHVLGHGGQK